VKKRKKKKKEEVKDLAVGDLIEVADPKSRGRDFHGMLKRTKRI